MADGEFSWRRCIAWTVALALHVAVLLPLSIPLALDGREIVATSDEAPRWIDTERATPVEIPMPEPEPMASPPTASTSPRVEPPRARRRVRPIDADPSAAADPPALVPSPAPVARTIAYLDNDARALLPQDDLYSATPPPREGDYYTPGDGTEDDVFYRPRALDPDPSKFAHAWRPRGDLLTDWLETLVEKTSGSVSIPLNPKFNLVCGGSIAAAAGGCAIVRNAGSGVIVQRPPPAPWDRANRVQCRELRQALEDAEEAAQVAYFLDRLSALCSADANPQRAL